MKVILTLIKKELLQTLRDSRMRMVILGMPIIEIIIFGFAISTDVKNFPIAVCDEDRSIASREIISVLGRGEYFTVKDQLASCRDAEKELYYNRAKMVVVIPSGYGENLLSGKKNSVQLLLDGSDSSSATIASGYVTGMLMGISVKQFPPVLVNIIPPAFSGISLETRVWYNPDMEARNFFLPGIVIMIITLIITLLTAMGITREKEAGTIEQLAVSPIAGWELVLGKTIPYLFIGVVDLSITTAAIYIIFNVTMNGNIFIYYLFNIVYIITMLGIGLFISTVSPSQGQAMMTVFAAIFPGIILSDFFFPIENMPQGIQWLTMLNPIKYAMHSQREVFIKGNGFETIGTSLIVLTLFAVFFYSYGAIRFRKSIS